MAKVFLGLGSNIDAKNNLHAGLERLQADYTLIKESPWYQSPAYGFDGADFINLAVEIVVDDFVAPEQLAQQLKQLEYDFGRAPTAVKYSSRVLDIDILLFDDQAGQFGQIQLPREDIWLYAFVLRPLLDIYPQGVCPLKKCPLHYYWSQISAQPLQLVESGKRQVSAR